MLQAAAMDDDASQEGLVATLTQPLIRIWQQASNIHDNDLSVQFKSESCLPSKLGSVTVAVTFEPH